MPAHDTFIHNENIKNFERQLVTETDPVRRALLKTLLRDEKVRVPEAPKSADAAGRNTSARSR